jgi:hypothetical protein
MRMPFGLYRGHWLSELPDQYISWLVGEDWLREPLKGALEREYLKRQRRAAEEPRQLRLFSGEMRDMAAQVIDVGYRHLAKTFHPDSGGEHDLMVRLNEVRDVLRKVIGL